MLWMLWVRQDPSLDHPNSHFPRCNSMPVQNHGNWEFRGVLQLHDTHFDCLPESSNIDRMVVSSCMLLCKAHEYYMCTINHSYHPILEAWKNFTQPRTFIWENLGLSSPNLHSVKVKLFRRGLECHAHKITKVWTDGIHIYVILYIICLYIHTSIYIYVVSM